ncbi:unnamed protein product [Rotaria sp. Silwood1]|nr:unnamed protein product [Rotaria sp. Silwood1]
MRRRSLYYFTNIVVPCFLISCMTILGFLLSPDSGEKLTLRELEFDDKKCVFIHFKSSEITTLLSVIMFSLLLSEILPSSSTAIPIITVYFMCVMIMTAVSVVASVLILSLHHRSPSNYAMPSWVRKYICNYLAWLLHMKRPNHDLTWRSIRRRWASPKQESDNLLGTIDNHQTKIPSEPLFDNTFELLSTNVINIDKEPLENQEKQHLDSILESAVPRAAEIHGPDYHQKTSNELYTCDMDTAHSELRVIISQLAILINYSRQKEKDDNESQDWQFVAMVIDRLSANRRNPSRFVYGPLTCQNGFVWREADDYDYICVTPATRRQTSADNAAASSRSRPGHTCISGYYTRNAYLNDFVCVTVGVKIQVIIDNLAATSRWIYG